jgi:cytochrome c biogenesis protein CcmG/thiol:disulfide interchange protein DsbE
MIFRWSALVRPLFLAAASLTFAAPAGAEPKLPPQATIPGIDLAQYRGKVVYLDFWASWCGPCQLSFPFMRDLATRFGDRDLVVVAVNLDHDRSRAQGFLNKYHPNFPIAYDPAGASARAFHVADMPTSIVIGRDGRVRYVHRGFLPADEQTYFTHVSELINERH